MGIPTPPIKLQGHCSAIYDNTLYVFTSSGFASIPLSLNGTWKKLAMGEPVSGSKCVLASSGGGDDEQALYVVGGTGGSPGYSGLQRYTFHDNRWQTLELSAPVIRNRVGHGAAYLKSSSAILVYAGSQQGGNGASSETFAINTASPHNISSFNADGVSPATSPVLVTWNDGQAAMLSGSTSNKIYHFNLSHGWDYSGLSFSDKIPNKQGYALVNGSDGSKILQSFKMDVSPNSVSSVSLLNPNGQPSSPNGIVNSSSLRKRKRDDSGDYPEYNGMLAPSSTRKDYSLAQDEPGSMVVISGGDDTEPLAIFNQTSNGWINATELFYGNHPLMPPPPPTTTTSPPTSSATHSTSAPPPPPPPSQNGSSHHSSAGTIAGATIGSIAGLALLLVAALFFFRRRMQKKGSGKGDGADDDKDRLSFQDRGLEPLTGAAFPMARSPVPLASRSVDSFGIFANGATVGQPPAIQVTGPQTRKGPIPSSSPLITVNNAPDEPPNSHNSGVPWLNPAIAGVPGDRTTAECWNRYFDDRRAPVPTSNNNNLNNLHNLRMPLPTPRMPVSSIASQSVRGSRPNSEWPSVSPADFDRPLGKVATANPTTAHVGSGDGGGIVIAEGQTARISSGHSLSTTGSDGDTFFEAANETNGENEGLGRPNIGRNLTGRPPSSTYSMEYAASINGPRIGSGSMGPRARVSSTVLSSAQDESDDDLPQRFGRSGTNSNVNSDMSWLDINARI